MAIDDVVVRREVILPVERKRAWRAVQDPRELAEWLADEVDLRIEAGAQGWMRSENGALRQVSVEEVVEQRRVVLRWAEAGGPETLVELVLDDVPEGTRLVVVELPVTQLEAAGELLSQGPPPAFGPQALATGPRMVAALA